MMRCYGYVVIFLVGGFFAATAAQAQVIAVPDQFATIQAAINHASEGDTVLVAPGTYVENINFRGKPIVVASRFALTRDPLDIAATIIDGSQPAHPDTGSVVLFISGEDRAAVLEGFTITNGTGTKWDDEHGGGFFTEGGGILVAVSSPTIKHNLIINNAAVRVSGNISGAGGGGMRCGDGAPLITNNVVASNRGMYGGGLTFNFGAPVIRNNIIYDNHVSGEPNFGGGGLAFFNPGSAPAIIENNIIVNNEASGSLTGSGISDRGGALMLWNTTVVMRNNIIWGNTQAVSSQIFTNGPQDIDYNIVEDGWSSEHNLTLDPTFADMGFALAVGSPAIDAGDLEARYNDVEDPSNAGHGAFPSQGSVRNDLGAYGGPGASVFPPPFLTSTASESPVGLESPGAYVLKPNYPNPFHPSTHIAFVIPQTTHVRVTIHDVLGRTITTLLDGLRIAGEHVVTWDADHQASGIYYYRLQAAGHTETKRMVLAR